jgi:hypothetical protein
MDIDQPDPVAEATAVFASYERTLVTSALP